MPSVFTIDGAARRGRRRKSGGTSIPPGECRCVTNKRSGRGVKICKSTTGKTRIKGAC